MTTTPPTPKDARREHAAEVRALYRHPDVRNYLVTCLAALVFVFAILFGRGSDLGGLLVVVIALCGVFLRWTAAPGFVVVLVTYFLLYPTGLPEVGPARPWDVRAVFRVEDVILAAALVVYTACQYRLLGFFSRALPAEGPTSRSAVPPADRRPPAAVAAGEVAALLKAAVAVVVGGQLLWLALTAFEVRTDSGLTLGAAEPGYDGRFDTPRPGRLSAPGSRFILVTGGVFLAAAVAQTAFWYWRLRTLGPDEARMVLQDTAWNETRRERVRVETWRAWAKRRAERRAKTRDQRSDRP